MSQCFICSGTASANCGIVHSFMYPYSNGITEGINNTIKVLKHISYGIKSFERLRLKNLWHQLVLQSFNKASMTE
uniref:transposase n=1 Tax=Alkalibacillus haloalkaliphilus TaxID=94136 RepID=UPI0024824B05|nr:transposase [Alkalibacillus haloalkaliphilus]